MTASPISPQRFQRLIRQALFLPIALLLLVGVVLIVEITTLVAASRWRDQTDLTISQANQTMRLMADAEAAERGYLISAKPQFIGTYNTVVGRMDESFAKLIAISAQNPAQSRSAAAMRDIAKRWIAESGTEIALRERGGDYVREFDTAKSQMQMNAMRSQFEKFNADEVKLHGHRATQVRRAADFALELSLLLAAGVAAVLAFSSRGQIVALSHTYEDTLTESESGRDLLATTLMSIGDGVLVIDTAGRVILMNAAAERLTGWTQAEALAHDSGEVLVMRAEADGSAIDNPVQAAIRGKVAIGPPGNIVLMRRDGAAAPIEESTNAIRGASGRLEGVVLVFRDVTARREGARKLAEVFAREHKIATRLQDALQPQLPASAPGLYLARYYKPALTEALVGGDFFDVFTTPLGATYLIVGDLSGKGLAAAAQVATVRNMLRFALHNRQTLSGPIASLNRTLAESDLLTGFATLFVGRFDASNLLLTYVNCGQENALAWKAATGEIRPMPPTGAVIGMNQNGEYAEHSLTLAAGDKIAIFTDGLTEAGPNRREMLGPEGVAALLAGIPPDADPEAAVQSIMAGVRNFAQQRVHDDVCLVIAEVARDAAGIEAGEKRGATRPATSEEERTPVCRDVTADRAEE